jgi:predicted secreted protein
MIINDSPVKIELKVGEKYTFKLKGLGAAGYNWGYTIEESKKVVSVSLEFADDQKNVKRILQPGYSRDVLVTIRALKPGNEIIHFAQQRSWEKDKPPVKEHVLGVSVKS